MFHERLNKLLDLQVHKIYDVTEKFPKSELFGLTSQLRRASLSIMLNYIEGYARNRKSYVKQYIEIAVGSFKETEYLVTFSYKRGYMKKEDFEELDKILQEVGKMLWGTLKNCKSIYSFYILCFIFYIIISCSIFYIRRSTFFHFPKIFFLTFPSNIVTTGIPTILKSSTLLR